MGFIDTNLKYEYEKCYIEDIKTNIKRENKIKLIVKHLVKFIAFLAHNVNIPKKSTFY